MAEASHKGTSIEQQNKLAHLVSQPTKDVRTRQRHDSCATALTEPAQAVKL